MSSSAELETVRRIDLLRAELDRSLKMASAEASSFYAAEKRPPLCVLFQSSEMAHIQISGPAHVCSDPSPVSTAPPPSRFTVSPTPNAVPAMTEGSCPLLVLTTTTTNRESNKLESISGVSVPTVLNDDVGLPVSASSPASSVDSGVASPGAGGSDLMQFPAQSSPSSTFPPWATVPRTRRWVFNFSNMSNSNNSTSSPIMLHSLIDALALSSRTCGPPSPTSTAIPVPDPPGPALTLQKPPAGKKYGPNNNDPPFHAVASQTPPKNNSKTMVSSTSSSSVAATKDHSNDDDKHKNFQQQRADSNMGSAILMQRQLSEGCAPLSDETIVNGLPPRAATMPPLKSILKKPRANSNSWAQHSTELPKNHMRRQPTRIVLNRSVSESLLDRAAMPCDQFSTLQCSAAAVFNATILKKLSMLPSSPLDTFDEQMEEQQVKEEVEQEQGQQRISSDGTSSPSSCSSENIYSDEQPAPITKKRVSFSEHVQARIYRSNSSILGQRRKNEKKSRHRTSRRCNSDASQTEQKEEFQSSKGPGMPFQNSSTSTVCRSRGLSTGFAVAAATNAGLPLLAQ